MATNSPGAMLSGTAGAAAGCTRAIAGPGFATYGRTVEAGSVMLGVSVVVPRNWIVAGRLVLGVVPSVQAILPFVIFRPKAPAETCRLALLIGCSTPLRSCASMLMPPRVDPTRSCSIGVPTLCHALVPARNERIIC